MNPAPLHALRVFVAAARRLSFQHAASELCVTPGAVSRQIQALEAHLGVPLFERRHRAVVLTQLGELYLAQCGPALDAVDAASRHVRALAPGAAGRPRGIVRLDATPAFAMHWLIPRLAEFRAQHPAIEVRLATSQGPIVRAGDVDLHIRRDRAHFAGLPGEAFMDERSVLVRSPRLPVRTAADSADAARDAPPALPDAPLVRMRSRPDLWPKWLARHGLQTTAGELEFIDFDNTILAIQAVVEGLGVGLIPELFVDGLRQGGALAIPPGEAPFATGAYHLLRGRPELSAAAETFRRWLDLSAAEHRRRGGGIADATDTADPSALAAADD